MLKSVEVIKCTQDCVALEEGTLLSASSKPQDPLSKLLAELSTAEQGINKAFFSAHMQIGGGWSSSVISQAGF